MHHSMRVHHMHDGHRGHREMLGHMATLRTPSRTLSMCPTRLRSQGQWRSSCPRRRPQGSPIGRHNRRGCQPNCRPTSSSCSRSSNSRRHWRRRRRRWPRRWRPCLAPVEERQTLCKHSSPVLEATVVNNVVAVGVHYGIVAMACICCLMSTTSMMCIWMMSMMFMNPWLK